MYFKSEESRERAISKLVLGRQAIINKSLLREKEYNKRPILCIQCQMPIPYKNRNNMFCSSSCSATYNNNHEKTGRKRIEKAKFCKNCNSRIPDSRSKRGNIFCDIICTREYHKKESMKNRMEQYKKGLLKDQSARNFFREITDKKCSICNLTKWNNKDIPLEVDHIDGDSENNFPSNLRFVCCNCAAQLPTFKGANRGNGRVNRK